MNVATPVVVDTDVISFLFKSHSLAPAYQALLAGRPLAVSLISLAEIKYGMEIKNWGSARRNLMHPLPCPFHSIAPGLQGLEQEINDLKGSSFIL
jgi:predicted nucleic acid-binding protein